MFNLEYRPRLDGVVKSFLIANIVVFFLQLISQEFWQSWIDNRFSLWPKQVVQGHVYQIFTYMWLHGGPWHLFFNMFGLYVFGKEVVETIGRRHFIWLYLLSGWLGGVLWCLFNLNSLGPAVGASAAVLGLVTAFAVLYPQARLFVFPIPIPIQARWLALGYAAFTLFQILFQNGSGGIQIAHLAHLGGMIAGYIYVKAFIYVRAYSINVVPLFSKNLPMQTKKIPTQKRSEKKTTMELDLILEKISQKGFESLTPQERAILEKASRDL